MRQRGANFDQRDANQIRAALSPRGNKASIRRNSPPEKIADLLDMQNRERKEIDTGFRWVSDPAAYSCNVDWYKRLAELINIAKSHGVHVSDVEARMPELGRLVYKKEMSDRFDELSDSTHYACRIDRFDRFKMLISEAKTFGINVSSYEACLSQLEEKACRASINVNFSSLLNPLSSNYTVDVLELTNSIVERVKCRGIDVSDIEAQLREIAPEVYRSRVDKQLLWMIEWTDLYFHGHPDDPLESAIKSAKEHGADVSDVEALLPVLDRLIYVYQQISLFFQWLRDPFDMSCHVDVFYGLKKLIEEAKSYGRDMSGYESQLPDLEQFVRYRAEVDKTLARVLDPQSFACDEYGLRYLRSQIDVAKKHNVDVSDVVARLPEIEAFIASNKS